MTGKTSLEKSNLERFFVQGVVTKNGTVMRQWTINDRECSNAVAIRIYRRENMVKKLCEIMNKEFGYLD